MTARKPSKGKRPSPLAPSSTAPVEIESVPLKVGSKTHPLLGFGLWSLGRWEREDEARTRRTAERALAAGLRWFDTAEVYGAGRSERLLGDVLARNRSDPAQMLVTTKVSWEHLRAAQVKAAVVGSLQKLGRTSVDLVLVHAPDRRVPIAETMGALETLWKE
ncbi:MAG TPA: aldo/keto reductase, partial [Thermoplasmata archaeon]|nr:aldo/keto reductase [Thermoplasmata archaeon]